MKVTVCQLSSAHDALAREWGRLVAHVQSERSDLVLLPEMPCSGWFPASRAFDPAVWRAAVEAHDAWEPRFADLAPAVTLATRPVDFGGIRYNAGFLWHATDEEGEVVTVHTKAYLRNEQGAWERTWYDKAVPEFVPIPIGNAELGVLIGSELWMLEQARVYGEDGVHILAVPRVSVRRREAGGPGMWIDAACTAAITSGAYCISSTRAGDGTAEDEAGWIISPDGVVLTMTTPEQPFRSAEIDLAAADTAKESYPRYVIFDVSIHRPSRSARPGLKTGVRY